MKRGRSTAPALKDAGHSSAHTEHGLLYLPSESQDGALHCTTRRLVQDPLN